MTFPTPPDKIVPFGGPSIQPYDIGRQFDEHTRAFAVLVDFLRTLVRDDGKLTNGSVGREQLAADVAAGLAERALGEVEMILARARANASRAEFAAAQIAEIRDRIGEAEARVNRAAVAAAAVGQEVHTSLARVEQLSVDAHVTAVNVANALNEMTVLDETAAGAEEWSHVSKEWAEHMPDTIPPNILAMEAITGDHWSSRWWANRAAGIVSSLGFSGSIGGDGVFAEALPIVTSGVCPPLTRTPAGPVLLVVNGMAFLPVGSSPPFAVSGRTISWMSTVYGLNPGDDVGAWYPYTASMTPAPPISPTKGVSLYYIATAGQTVFPVTTPDYFGASFTATVATLRVTRNGARLMPDAGDGLGGYRVSGSTVTLLYPAGAGESVAIDVWGAA